MEYKDPVTSFVSMPLMTSLCAYSKGPIISVDGHIIQAIHKSKFFSQSLLYIKVWIPKMRERKLKGKNGLGILNLIVDDIQSTLDY